jgi:hypothetical protein
MKISVTRGLTIAVATASFVASTITTAIDIAISFDVSAAITIFFIYEAWNFWVYLQASPTRYIAYLQTCRPIPPAPIAVTIIAAITTTYAIPVNVSIAI